MTCKSVNFVNIVSVILDCVLLVTRLDFVVYFYIISQSRHSFVHSLAEKKSFHDIEVFIYMHAFWREKRYNHVTL